MDEAPPPVRHWTRRAILAAGSAGVAFCAKGQETDGEAKKFLDAATEFEILRVTGLGHNAWLPLASNRAFTRKGDALLLASDAGGTPQLYRHDFKLNRLRQLTDVSALNTNLFSWLPGDRGVLYVDGRRLLQSGTPRDRVVHEFNEDWAASPRLAMSDDGMTVVVSSFNGTRTRIFVTGRAPRVAEERDGDIGTLYVRPKRAEVSYISGGALWRLPLAAKQALRVKTAPGEVLSSHWTADGATLLYLLRPDGSGRLTEIREAAPEAGTDELVAKTSQFVHFVRNGDATVFLGASGSLASPHLLVLLRSVKRELTLCEHRCSDARLSRAVLSPNSARMAFQTDRHGKLVIYSMAVDRLIEQTEDKSPA
jgi:hypothetical protein